MVSLGWAGLDPAHISDENSSLGFSIPYTTLGQVSALPNEAMNSINVLHSDRGRILVSRDTTPLQRPRRVNCCVRRIVP